MSSSSAASAKAQFKKVPETPIHSPSRGVHSRPPQTTSEKNVVHAVCASLTGLTGRIPDSQRQGPCGTWCCLPDQLISRAVSNVQAIGLSALLGRDCGAYDGLIFGRLDSGSSAWSPLRRFCVQLHSCGPCSLLASTPEKLIETARRTACTREMKCWRMCWRNFADGPLSRNREYSFRMRIARQARKSKARGSGWSCAGSTRHAE